MTNIYDQFFEKDIIEKAPSQNTGNDFVSDKKEEPAFNIYEEFFNQRETSINNQVKRSLQLVMEKDPDKTGEALRLQEELGLGKNFALDSDEAIKLMRAKAERDRIESFRLAKYSPILHRQLTDPAFAALAYDNLENLQGMEKFFNDFTSLPENISQGWEKGRLQVTKGHLGVEKWLGSTDEKVDFEIAEIDERIRELESDGTGPFEEAFAVFGQYSKSLPKAVGVGTASAGVGAAATSWSGPGALVGAKTGFIWGFMGSLAYDALAIEGGNVYLALTSEKFDPTHARWISLGAGLASAALEIWGLSFVTAPVRKLLIKETTKQIAKQLAKPSGKLALRNFITNYAKTGTFESFTEVGQEVTQILARELAVLLDDRENIESQLTSWEGIKEVADQLRTVFWRSIQAMSIVGLVGSGPTFISDLNKARNAKKNEVFFEELTKQASTSKLKERSVTEFDNFTQQLGDKKNISHVYVDANVFFNAMNQEGISIEDVEQISPTIANQLKEFEKSGTISGEDVAIPIGEYTSKLIGTDFDNKVLKQNRRLDKEDSFSPAENTFFEANREAIEKEANEIRSRDENRNKKFRASAAKVKKDFANMLRATGMGKATGKFRNKDVQYAATFLRDYAITQANKLNILPHEFAERFPYKIVGADQAQILAQQNLNDVDQEIATLKKELNELGEAPSVQAELQNWKTKTDAINDKISDLESERETFSQQAKPQEQGKPVPQAVFQIARIEENFDFASSKPFARIRDFKLEIQNRIKAEAKKAGVDLSQPTVEVEKYLVQAVLDDANYALIENSNAVGWYNEKVTKAKRILSLIHPELATDPKANFAFTWALANTSNQIEVNKNFALAEIAYKQWRETGKFPTDIGIGTSTNAINHNFELYNRLIEEKPFEQLEKFMRTQHTVKEVEAYTNDTVSGENLSEIVYGAAVLGPKIGNGFFANLYGQYEQLTMDRWLIRTWGRLTGTLVKDQRKQANMKRDQLKPLLKALTSKEKKQLQDLIGVKIRMTNLDEVAIAIDKTSTKKSKREIMKDIGLIKDNPDHEQFLVGLLGKAQRNRPRIGIGDEIRKNGISYAKYLDGQKEDPSGAPERRFIRKVFNQVLPVLQEKQPDLTMADLQALLWYPEKRLYDSAKLKEAEDTTGYVDDEAPDYANAAVLLARNLDVSDADIQNIIEEVDNELESQTPDRTGIAESGERTTDVLQRDNETFSQGKTEPKFGIDERTGLPLNENGTVTVYHHTNRKAAEGIKATNQLRSAGEPDVYVTTRAIADTGYGDTAVAIRVDPSRLSLDDEFPNGRKDYRLNVGKPRGTIRVEVGEFLQQGTFEDTRGKGEFYHGSATEIELTEGGEFATDQNIYGPGFYATDDLITAGKYQKKNREGGKPKRIDYTWKDNPEEAYQADLAAWEESRKPTVYKVTEKQPIKFYDLDQPVTDDLKAFINSIDDSNMEDIVSRSADALGEDYTLGQLYDEIRGYANANDISASTVTDVIFPQFIDFLKDKGFGGFTHQGGKLAAQGKRLHQVRIYWDPADSIEVSKVETESKQELFGQDTSRGSFNPKTLTTFLSKEADISTFFHETAHFMLTVTEDLVMSGQATPQIQNDFNVLLDFWGVKDLETWKGFSLDEKRKYHEAFAYNYEIYITEQKAAPSVALQEVFIRFGNMIRTLYKSIRDDLNEIYKKENGRDLPVLTDEVRDVMDRMVANEEQITYSQRVYDMRPMFETQELSGMDDATWKEYTEAIQESQDAAIDKLNKDTIKQLKWLGNKGKLTETLQDKEIKEIRKKVEAEETVKAENETLYKLEKFLKKGEWTDKDNNPFRSAGTHKIDIDSIRNLILSRDIKDVIKALGTGRWGMVSKDGLDVNIVAELFGFETAEGMINGLVDLEKIEDVIKERTKQRMLDEYSGLTDPKLEELRILEAIQNEARAKFLAIELRFLNKSMQPVRLQVAAARQVAKSILNKTRISEIRPKKYAQNERRSRKNLEIAMKNGDDQGAIDAKRSELLNSQLSREAAEIRERYNKSLKKFKDIFKKSDEETAKSRTVDYVNAAQEILSRFGLGPQLEEGITYVDNLKKYDEHIYEEVQDIITATQKLSGREIKDLTLQDFDTLDETIDSLMYQARRDMQFRVEGELRERKEISNELSAALDNMDPRASFALGEGGQTKWWERMVSALEGLKALLRRVEHWCDSKDGEVARLAGDKSYAREIRGGGLLGGGVLVKKEGEVAGPFTRYIWRTLKDPINKWRTERPKWTGRYVDLLEQVDWSQGKISAPELISKNGKSYVFGRERGMGKAELLGAMLHMGNKSNLTKLLDGRGWGKIRDNGTLDSSKWQSFIDRMIDEGHIVKKDLDFLQAVWDLNAELLPLTQRAHKDVFGYYFKTVELTPLVTKFGTYRGGYVPAVADPEMSTRELTLDESIKAIKDEMKYAAPAVERGFTKPRTQKNRPLSLNLGLQAAHLDNALRFAYIQPAITDLLRLFRDKKFSNSLNRVDDKAMQGMLMPWLKNSASQKTTLGNAKALHNRAITRLTKSTTLNYMFASLKNGMQQVTGKLPARLKIEHKYLNDAFRRYTREPHKVANQVAEMSPFMRDRQLNQMFDVQDLMNDLIINPKKYEKFQKWVGKHAYFVQQAFQNYVDSVVWIAKYNQVLTNAPKTMTEAQIHAEAIQQADGAVRMTQDSLLPEDVAAYQINIPLAKAIFQFTSYFNAQANLNATHYKALIKELGWKSKQFSGQILFTFLFGFALPALVSEGIQELASGGLADEDEDGYIDEFFEFGYMSLFRYGSAFIPTGSSFIMVPLNMLDDKPYNDRMTISPSMSLINSTMQGSMRFLINLADPEKEVKGNEVRSILTLLGLIGKVPVYPIAKPIGLLHDLKDGRWVPRGPADLIRGLVTGQAGEGRR